MDEALRFIEKQSLLSKRDYEIIHERFIRRGAKQQINIDHKLRNQLQGAFEHNQIDLYAHLLGQALKTVRAYIETIHVRFEKANRKEVFKNMRARAKEELEAYKKGVEMTDGRNCFKSRAEARLYS